MIWTHDCSLICFFAKLPNGLRYLRWGCGRRSRPTGKMLRRRKMLGIAAESPASGARFVGRRIAQDSLTVKPIAVFKMRISPNDTPVKTLLQFLLPRSSQNILLFLWSFQLVFRQQFLPMSDDAMFHHLIMQSL